jgi:hypothetical protein
MPLMSSSWNQLESWLWRMEQLRKMLDVHQNASPFGPLGVARTPEWELPSGIRIPMEDS